MPTEGATQPKLSDLVRDWAEQEGWPITVRPSVLHMHLQWVETKQLASTVENSPIRGVYIGTVHDDEAYFAPYPEHTTMFIDAVDPEFFNKIIACIRGVFDDHPLLDQSALPHVK